MVRIAWLLGLLALTFSTRAAELWTVDPQASRIGFIASYDGIEFPGHFERWRGAIRFSPDDLNGSKLAIVVDMTSVNTRNRERDQGIRSSEWFDAATFAEASYQTTRLRRLPSGAFQADASFELKGVARPLRSTFEWSDDGEARWLRGQVTVDRRELRIGTGEWATDPVIGFEVRITYDIRLVPARR